MKKVLVLLAFALATATLHAQSTLYLKNIDSDSIHVQIESMKIDTWVHSKEIKNFSVSAVTPHPSFTAISSKGKFGGESAQEQALPKGKYIMVFMWSTKDNVWRTIMRPYTDED